MGRSCLKIISCGCINESVDKDEVHVSSQNKGPDKPGWSFRKKSPIREAPSNTLVTEKIPSSEYKKISEPITISSEPHINSNISEKTSDDISTEETPNPITKNAIVSTTATKPVCEEDNIKCERVVEESESESKSESAVLVIQAAVRRFLAERQLVKHKNVVKLQAAVRGHLVRNHAVGTLRCVQAIVKMQALVRARQEKGMQNPEIVNATPTHISIEKLLSNRLARQLLESTPKTKQINIKCDPLKSDSSWSWLERWMSVSSPETLHPHTPDHDQDKVVNTAENEVKMVISANNVEEATVRFEEVPIRENVVSETEHEPIPENSVSGTKHEPVPENVVSETEPEAIPENPVLETEPEAILENLVLETEPKEILENPVSETEPEPIPKNLVSETELAPIPENLVSETERELIPKNPVLETKTKTIPENPVLEIEPEVIPENLVSESKPEAIPVNPVSETEPEAILENLVSKIEPERIPENPVSETEPEPEPEPKHAIKQFGSRKASNPAFIAAQSKFEKLTSFKVKPLKSPGSSDRDDEPGSDSSSTGDIDSFKVNPLKSPGSCNQDDEPGSDSGSTADTDSSKVNALKSPGSSNQDDEPGSDSGSSADIDSSHPLVNSSNQDDVAGSGSVSPADVGSFEPLKPANPSNQDDVAGSGSIEPRDDLVNHGSRVAQKGGSECGTELSITSTLDSPDSFEIENTKFEEANTRIDFDNNNNYHYDNNNNNNNNIDIVTPEKQVDQKPDNTYIEPESSHITNLESQGTPSSQISTTSKKTRTDKKVSVHPRNSWSTSKRSSPVTVDSGLRTKESKPEKRRNSLGSPKPDGAPVVPGYMQATESARAKVVANSSPRSSPDLKKRHSLPGAVNGRHGSPQIQRSMSQALQATKGNGNQERKWQR